MTDQSKKQERAYSNAMVDAHCHVDLYPKPEAIVAMAEAHKIYTIAVTNAPSVFHYTAALTTGCRHVRAALGLHPQLAHLRAAELTQMWSLLGSTRYVGEIGLDYQTTDPTERKIQQTVFSQILDKCAEYGDKVITLHSRRATSDVIAAVGDRYPGKIILHWFSGTAKELEKASGLGMHFSVNSAMVRSEKGRRLIQQMPPERVITETDGPFVQIDGENGQPSQILSVITNLAQIWNLSVEEARVTVLQNFRSILK